MTELGVAVGTGVVREVELGGRKWRVRPLTLNDLAEYEEWLEGERRRAMKASREEYVEMLRGAGVSGPDLVSAIRERVREDEKSANIGLETLLESMITPEGLARAFWLAARPFHGELTSPETASSLVPYDPETVRAVVQVVMPGARVEGEEGKKEGNVLEAQTV